MPKFTFNDVSVTIAAASEREAYKKLTTALSLISVGFSTGTVSTDGGDERDTAEISPISQ